MIKPNDIEVLSDALDKIGIPYTVRKSDEYEYLFIGAPTDACCITGMDDNFETTSLDNLLRRHKCFEFECGDIASWSAINNQ